MQPRKDRVQVLGEETGVFEEDQQRQVVNQADQEPDLTAAIECPQPHEEHEHTQASHRRPQGCRTEHRQDQDPQRSQARTHECDFQHPIIKLQPRQAPDYIYRFALVRAVVH